MNCGIDRLLAEWFDFSVIILLTKTIQYFAFSVAVCCFSDLNKPLALLSWASINCRSKWNLSRELWFGKSKIKKPWNQTSIYKRSSWKLQV